MLDGGMSDAAMLEVGSRLKQQRKTSEKKNVSKRRAVKVERGRQVGFLPSAVTKQKLDEMAASLDELPKQSAFVRHRKRMLQTAMRLHQLG
eukprot:gene30847-35887_t